MGQMWTIEGYIKENPQEACAYLAEWLKGQSQEVWAQVIRGLESRKGEPAHLTLHWMIGRRELDRANAVRLFWSLFDVEVWMKTREDARALDAMQRLVDRFEAGFCTVSVLELTRREAFYFKDRLVSLTRRPVLDGWSEAQAAFEIPRSFFRPLKGQPVEARPAFRPARMLTGGLRVEAEELGRGIAEAGAAVMGERAKRALRGWWLTRLADAALFVVLPLVAVASYYLLKDDLGQMLASVGL